MSVKKNKINILLKALLIGLFTLFTLRYQQEFFHYNLGIGSYLTGSFIAHLVMALVATGVAFFCLKQQANLQQNLTNFYENNQTQLNSLKQIAKQFLAVTLIGSLFYYLGVREQKTADFRSLKVELGSELDSVEVWQTYFYTLAGYTAQERQDAQLIDGEVIFPINTKEPFSKIRIDVSDHNEKRSYRFKRISLIQNNQVVKTIAGQTLFDLITPLEKMIPRSDIDSLQYLPISQETRIVTTERKDPYLEFAITDKDFRSGIIEIDWQWLLTCMGFGVLTFLLLINYRKLGATYQRLTTNSKSAWLTNLAIALIVGILGFLALQNRDKAIPLKLMSVEFAKKPNIPQDLWKTYLRVDGTYAETFSLMGWSSGKMMYFSIPEGLDFDKLRLDPGITSQEFLIEEVTIRSGFEVLKSVNGNELFGNITPINQIKNYGINQQTNEVIIETEEGDPFFELNIGSPDFLDKSAIFEGMLAFLIALLTFLCLRFLPQLKQIDWGSKRISQYFLGANLVLLLGNLLFLGDWRYFFLLFNLVWLFLLPGKWLQRKSGFRTGFPLGDNLMAVAIGIAILLFPLYFFYALNVPYAHWIAMFFAFCFGLLYLSDEFNDDNKTLFVPKEINLDLLLFNVFFFLFLSPIKDLLAPPLHDPAIIASIANDIIDGNFTKNFIHISNWSYPPYLQLLTAFLAKLSGMITPKVLLFVTNLFIFLSGLAFGGMWGQFFKNRYAFWVSTSIFLFISPTIPDLYYTAGKNAMIFSFFYWFILLWAGLILMEKKAAFSPYQGLVYAFLLIAGFQFNYIIVFLFPVIGIFVLIWLYNDLKLGKKLFLKKYKTLLLSGLIPGLFFGAFAYLQYQSSLTNDRFSLFFAEWTVNKKSEQKQPNKKINPPSNSQSAENNNVKVEPIAGPSFSTKIVNFTKEISDTFGSYYRRFVNLLEHYSKDYSLFRDPTFSRLTGWLLLLLFIFSVRKKEIILVLVFSTLIMYLNQSYIYNLMHYSKVLRFVPPLLAGTFFVNLLFHQFHKSRFISLLLLIPLGYISILQMAKMTENYNQIRSNSVLTKYDLEAIDYIDENLANKGYFMPANVGNLSRILPYHADASLYLGLTKSEAAISFIQGNIIVHASEEFNDLKSALRNWQNDEPSSKFQLFPLMRALNVKYIYSGAYIPTGRQMDLTRLDEDPSFSLIYENHGVKIYEIDYDL